MPFGQEPGLLCKAIKGANLHSWQLKVTMTRHVTFGSGLAIRSPRTRKELTVMQSVSNSLSVVLLVGCLVTSVVVTGEQEGAVASCEGPYVKRMPTPEELATVLDNHRGWVESGEKPDDQRRANLCQANLAEANLVEANLQGASLV